MFSFSSENLLEVIDLPEASSLNKQKQHRHLASVLLFVDKCGQVASVGIKQFTQVYGNAPLPKTVTKTMERDFLQFSPQTNHVNYCMNANQLCKYKHLDLTVYCLPSRFDIGLGL